MTYLELYEKSLNDLEHNKITLGEFEERIKPLKQESINVIKELEQIRAEIDALDKWGQTFYRYNEALGDCIEIIDNHIEEMKGE